MAGRLKTNDSKKQGKKSALHDRRKVGRAVETDARDAIAAKTKSQKKSAGTIGQKDSALGLDDPLDPRDERIVVERHVKVMVSRATGDELGAKAKDLKIRAHESSSQ